jgi:hypothetical protein
MEETSTGAKAAPLVVLSGGPQVPNEKEKKKKENAGGDPGAGTSEFRRRSVFSHTQPD